MVKRILRNMSKTAFMLISFSCFSSGLVGDNEYFIVSEDSKVNRLEKEDFIYNQQNVIVCTQGFCASLMEDHYTEKSIRKNINKVAKYLAKTTHQSLQDTALDLGYHLGNIAFGTFMTRENILPSRDSKGGTLFYPVLHLASDGDLNTICGFEGIDCNDAVSDTIGHSLDARFIKIHNRYVKVDVVYGDIMF